MFSIMDVYSGSEKSGRIKIVLVYSQMFAQSISFNDIDINTIAYWAFPSIYGNSDSQLNCKTGKYMVS